MAPGRFFMSKWRDRAGTDGMFAAGLLIAAAGLAAFDWRVALVVVGGVLMALAVLAARRGEE